MKMESLPPNKTKVSFFCLTRCTPVEEAAANEKKREFFLPNKTNAFSALFFRNNGRHDVDQWKKRSPFSPPNKTKIQGKDSLRRIKCAAI